MNYTIEPARVGQSIDYERLILEVWTNGAITPEEAVTEAANIARDYFGQIADTANTAPQKTRPIEEPEPEVIKPTDTAKNVDERYNHPIHELELSIRSENCLLRGGIQTIGDLVTRSRDDLLKIRNLGRKSLTEIEEKIAAFGFTLMPPKPAEEKSEDTADLAEKVFEDTPKAEAEPEAPADTSSKE